MELPIPKNAFRLPRVEPRLGEFDLGGVLYHARYFHIYEDAREALLREIGTSYPELVNRQIHLAVVESHQEFPSAVRYGVPFEVSLWIAAIRRSFITFRYVFRDERKSVIHAAWTKHVVVEKRGEQFSPIRLPIELQEGLERFTEALPADLTRA